MKKRKKTPPKRAHYTKIKNPYNNLPLDIYTYGGTPCPTPGQMPSSVKVYGQEYKVYYHSRIYCEPRKNQRLRGVVMYSPRVIYIDPEQSIHDMKETLYHETGHIYLKVWQTKSEALSKLTYQQIEDVCDMIGEAVPDLTGNNPI